jgi:putative redox protein
MKSSRPKLACVSAPTADAEQRHIRVQLVRLLAYLARPDGQTDALLGVIICHSFSFGTFDGGHSESKFPELTDRIAKEIRITAISLTFTKCGEGPGDFVLESWVDDQSSAIDHMSATAQPAVLLPDGSNTGGSLAMCVAACNPRIHGCAFLVPRAYFDYRAAQPRSFHYHC